MNDKEVLLRTAQTVAKDRGWKMRRHGTGNTRQYKFTGPWGTSFTIWYPVEPRVNDIELEDMREAIAIMHKGSVTLHDPNTNLTIELAG